MFPCEAGETALIPAFAQGAWIPAFAGMTFAKVSM